MAVKRPILSRYNSFSSTRKILGPEKLKLEWKSLETLPKNDTYIVDVKLVLNYMRQIPHWKQWADEYIKSGKKFVVLPRTMQQLQHPNYLFEKLPTGFIAIEPTSKDITALEHLRAEMEKKIGTNQLDIEHEILEAGYFSSLAANFNDSSLQKTVFASARLSKLLYAFRDKSKLQKFRDFLCSGDKESSLALPVLNVKRQWTNLFP